MQQNIFLLGLNHRTAGVEVREKFALSDCLSPDLTEPHPFALDEDLHEVIVLSTCNRVEILAVGRAPDLPQLILRRWAAARGEAYEDLAPYVYIHEGLDAVRHLFSVASSLDSMVVGEPQILGQLKDAYRQAMRLGATRVILNRLLHKAFSVAKRVRTQTEIGSSAVSISYAAVELAKRIFGDMGQYQAMLVGAGEMAELAAAHLLRAGVKQVFVANRTFARAEELARQWSGQALPFEALYDKLAEVDIVISSTGSPTAIIRAKDIKDVLKRRKNRPMFFIDIAVPRDIDPDVNNLDNVYLYDIDDLKEVVEENLSQRREEATRARDIVDDEAERFGRWLKSLDLQPTIVDLLRYGESVGARELAKTLKRLGPDASNETRDAVETLVRSLTQKLYHEPIVFLKRRADEEHSVQRYIDYTRRMFNLDGDIIPDNAHAERRRPLDEGPGPARHDE